MSHRNLAPIEQPGFDRDRVVVISDWQDLRKILDLRILAVILLAKQRPAWVEELASAVSSASFVVPRTILANATPEEVSDSVAKRLEDSPLSPGARQALREDMELLVHHCGELTGSKRFRFRFFTDTPNCRCSYHVDAVPPRAPTTALIRVYCGAPTEFVIPSNLTCWEDFYSYVFRRDQQVKAIATARQSGDSAAEAVASAKLSKLENSPPFLIQSDAPPQTVPTGALVACKFVDSYYLWGSTHVHARSARGWIHRSPMTGDPRFVATVNAVA
jgi:hypothetical protein